MNRQLRLKQDDEPGPNEIYWNKKLSRARQASEVWSQD